MTHKELCALAVAWLQRPSSRSGPGCLVAVSETSNWINGEIPDAIGWRPYKHARCGSVIVEVKTSRADFLADANKPHRKDAATGMGVYRYFMAPEQVIPIEKLPAKWGLIEVTKRGHMKVRAGHVLLSHHDEDRWRHEHNHAAEIGTLAMCLNRVSDPQKVQNRLRELGNMITRLTKQNQDLSTRNRDLSKEVFVLRNPTGDTTRAIARRSSG